MILLIHSKTSAVTPLKFWKGLHIIYSHHSLNIYIYIYIYITDVRTEHVIYTCPLCDIIVCISSHHVSGTSCKNIKKNDPSLLEINERLIYSCANAIKRSLINKYYIACTKLNCYICK